MSKYDISDDGILCAKKEKGFILSIIIEKIRR